MKQATRGLHWLPALGEHHPAKTGMTRVRRHAGLMPVGDSDGAILAWMFDKKPGTTHVLFVRLTEDEANSVHQADPYSTGLLEPVRRKICNRWAVLAVKCGDTLYAVPYQINRRGTEDEFIADLDAAAATCPAYMVAHRKATLPQAQLFAQEMARDLAFA